MVLPPRAAAVLLRPEVGGLPAGKVFLAGPLRDDVVVPVDAAPGGAWESRLRRIIDGTSDEGFGPKL